MSKSDLLPHGHLFDPAMKLEAMQALPLDDKIFIAKRRIREWYENWGGRVHVSFSGGKDSTVLLHLVRSMYPDVRAVFSDTGLEFPEIRDFVKEHTNIGWVRPAMTFDKVIEKHGYPIISKEQAQYIRQAREGTDCLRDLRAPGKKGEITRKRFCVMKCWRRLIDAPFRIGEGCCRVMKKEPMKLFEKWNGTYAYVGTMAEDSRLRMQQFEQHGCNMYNADRPISKPLSVWVEADVWAYIRKYNVPYCKIYDMGYTRTGCMFCGFGAHMDTAPNRFQRMALTHPKQWRYCMDKLGMRKVLAYIGVEVDPLTNTAAALHRLFKL